MARKQKTAPTQVVSDIETQVGTATPATDAVQAVETATDDTPAQVGTDAAPVATDAAPVATDAATDAPAEVAQDADAQPVRKGSIVPNDYKRKYRAFGNSCGDEMADAFATQVKTKQGTDMVKLREIGTQNGVDVETRWGHLNVGQQRMNLSNVLRNRLKTGGSVTVGEVTWGGEDLDEAAA